MPIIVPIFSVIVLCYYIQAGFYFKEVIYPQCIAFYQDHMLIITFTIFFLFFWGLAKIYEQDEDQ